MPNPNPAHLDNFCDTCKADPCMCGIRCQFCGEVSPEPDWLPNDACPKCRKVYDPMLLLDEDDE